MSTYAIVDGDEIVNVIVAESAEIASAVTGLPAIPAGPTGPGIGWQLVEGEWRPQSPYESWVWDGANGWVPPVPYPNDGGDETRYTWSEEVVAWVTVGS